MRKSEIIVLVLILVSIIVGILLYDKMPDRMASHWDAGGEVNGYMGKFWGLFLLPIISIVMFLLFHYLPMIDPMKENVEKFRKYYDCFIILIFVFLLYIYSLTIAWNLSYRFSMILSLMPAFALLFYYSGVLISKAKRNWFIGIRTPWTLSSDFVWDKTHILGGRLFKVSGLLSLAGLLFPDIALWFVLVPVIVFSLFLFYYSYWLFKREDASVGKRKVRR